MIVLLLLLSDPAARGLLPFGSVTYSENDMCLLVGWLSQKVCSVCQVTRGGIFLLDLLTLCSRIGGVQLSLLDGCTKGMLYPQWLLFCSNGCLEVYVLFSGGRLWPGLSLWACQNCHWYLVLSYVWTRLCLFSPLPTHSANPLWNLIGQ